MSFRTQLLFTIGCSAILSGADLRVSRQPAFSVEASENISARFPGAPRLQSFAWAQWDGKWIFIGGRTGGYHGVGGTESDFPRKGANARIWVVDPSGAGPARTFSFPIASLPASLAGIKDAWMSSNLLFFQDKETLHLAGGYGQNSKGAWVTYPILSTVNLPALIDGVTKGRDTFSQTIAYVESPLVQVTGGELLKLDDGMFYVIGGHIFMGSYLDFEAGDEKNTPKVSQTYTGEIRKLSIKRDTTGLAVSLVETYKHPEFARRDLNAAFTILPDGRTLGAAVYGGVFTKDQLNFSKAIHWTASLPPRVDDAFEQRMSAYSCAKLLLFDPGSGTMYSTFFGGISRWTFNYAKQEFEIAALVGDKTKPVYFDGLQWIDHITTLVRGPESTYEAVQPTSRLAGYLGTNAAFIPAAGLKRIRADVDIFDIGPLRGKRVLMGYLYGGIRAFPREFPYRDDSPLYSSGNVPTKTSDMIIAVYVTVPAAE